MKSRNITREFSKTPKFGVVKELYLPKRVRSFHNVWPVRSQNCFKQVSIVFVCILVTLFSIRFIIMVIPTLIHCFILCIYVVRVKGY